MSDEVQPDEKSNLPAQFSVKWLLGCVVLFAIAFAGLRFARNVLEVPNDAYAMWAAGDVLIDYMSANQSTWPDSWETLSEFHDSYGAKSTMVGPFAEMRSRIHIDFTFDPKSVMSTVKPNDNVPPFRVVALKDGGDTHWSGMEPNQRIFEHLKMMKLKSLASDLDSEVVLGEDASQIEK